MFVFSKVFWFLIDPANLILVALCLSTLMVYFSPTRRAGRRLLTFTVGVFLLLAVFPVGYWMTEKLENRFPTNPALPDRVAGIIVLGGTVDQILTLSRQQPALTSGAERLTEFIRLGYLFPDAELVFTGGSGSVFTQPLKETEVARLFFEQMHFDEGRVVYESESRNTFENAILSRDLVNPGPNDVWILVTSAMHMPRAVGCFRQAGWNIIPYPVDYNTRGIGSFQAGFDPIGGLKSLNTALHEWVGLAAYRLLGRTSSLFPGPQPIRLPPPAGSGPEGDGAVPAPTGN